ncbi:MULTISPECIES: TetR/AcrR family transcriptional regulator [Bacillus]|nr:MULTISPECIES: TetR/AcrR family transcriptional regulator [Bacillus]MBP1081921.1 AcrR family transcriptional regulator [Bacillus capparidis]
MMDKKNSILSKKDILDAAEKTLRRFGPNKTSVTDVAKELNISHGTIYRHFPNKAALKEAVTERWLEEEIIAPLKRFTHSEESASAHLLKEFIFALCSLKRSHAENDEEMFKMYAEVTVESTEIVENHVNCIIEMLSLIIEKGIHAKIIKDINHNNALSRSIFYATTRFHHPSHAYEWKSETIDEELDLVWALIKEGFVVSKAEHKKQAENK